MCVCARARDAMLLQVLLQYACCSMCGAVCVYASLSDLNAKCRIGQPEFQNRSLHHDFRERVDAGVVGGERVRNEIQEMRYDDKNKIKKAAMMTQRRGERVITACDDSSIMTARPSQQTKSV